MIVKVQGILERVTEDQAHVSDGGITYAVMISRTVAERLTLTGMVGQEVTLHTMYYLEGGVGMGHILPRLVGFLNETDLEFFSLLITVQGLSVKRSLRALTIPVKDVARAIELGDTGTLKKLPEVGGKTVQKIIMELKGKVAKFALLREDELPVGPEAGTLDEFQHEALSILRQLQYNDAEADAMIRRMREQRPDIVTAEELIQELFRSQTGP